MANRRFAVRRTFQLFHIFFGTVVDRPNRTSGQCDAHEQSNDGLRHRIGSHALFRGSIVLVALDENRIALEDEQRRGAVVGKIVVQAVASGLVSVGNRRFGRSALQQTCPGTPGDLASQKKLVVVTHHADQASRLYGYRRGAYGITFGPAEYFLVRRRKSFGGNKSHREKKQPFHAVHPQPWRTVTRP